MEEHYVIFYSPGSFVSEVTKKKIDSWDIKKAHEMSKDIVERYNAKPYCFVFETYDNDILKKSSGKYHLNSIINTYDDIVYINKSEEEILRMNMIMNSIWVVAINNNSHKHISFFESSDVLLDLDGNIIAKGSDYTEYCRLQNNKKAG